MNVSERGRTTRWRRGRDSNPRYGYPYAAFRVRCFQPLSHLSKPLANNGQFRFSCDTKSPMVTKMVTNPFIWRARLLQVEMPRRGSRIQGTFMRPRNQI